MGKRTDIDFSRHEITIIVTDGLLVHTLKRPDSVNYMIKFINTNGILAVTGDLGNWIFCREFHPNSDNYVSDEYWDEKLRIASVQKPKEYDVDETIRKINEFETNFYDAYGRDMGEDEKDWVEQLKNSVEDKYEYIFTAYRETPNTIDYESIPFGEKRHFWLDGIYDGFDIICERLKK